MKKTPHSNNSEPNETALMIAVSTIGILLLLSVLMAIAGILMGYIQLPATSAFLWYPG